MRSAVPYGHWMTTTLVAALRHDDITAPCVFDRPMNGASFRTYVEHFLAPVLRQGDIVVMDNLASHKGRWPRRFDFSVAVSWQPAHTIPVSATGYHRAGWSRI